MHNGMTLTRIQGQGHRDPNALAEVDRQSPYGTNFIINKCVCCFQQHYFTTSTISPSVQRSVHHNMSAPSSPVHSAKSEHRTTSSHEGDGFHRQQPSLPHTGTTRIHTSTSDHGRYADTRHGSTQRDSGHGDRSRVDHDYTDYAYVRAAAATHPQTRDAFSDYRPGGNWGTDNIYVHPHWPSRWAETSRDVEDRVNIHQRMDGNLYHIASNRTMSYASSDESQAPLPVTAAATSSRFLDPPPYWSSRHGSLEGGYRRQNGDMGSSNLSAGGLVVGSSPYADSNVRLPERSYDVVPPRQRGSPLIRYETPPHVHAGVADTSYSSVELSPADPSTVVVRGQNCFEVSKPFEMADVFKYSSRVRRTAAEGGGDRIADLRSTSSPHLSTREPQYRDRPAYVAPSLHYPPSRHHQKPVFD